MSLALFDILTGRAETWIGSETRMALESVQSHLHRLFNARRGSLIHLPDYGLPDLGSIYENLPYSVAELAHRVRELIECYEPRLSAVQVRQVGAVDDDRRIRLEIAAHLVSVGEVRFQTVFESAGSAQVREQGVRVGYA
jgi:type VI secretion system protein